MVVEASHHSTVVPLKFEGVIVGLVSIGDNNNDLLCHYTSKGTGIYVRELILSDEVESISLVVDRIEDTKALNNAKIDRGQLRLI